MRASLLDAASTERDAGRKIFRIFVEGDDLFDAMLGDVEHAAETVRMQTCIFADDEVSLRFVEALCHAASGGNAIVLRLDAFGAWNGLVRDSEERLLRADVLLRWSRAWSWRSPFTLFRRNHRKLLIVDGRVAYLGDFNIHRENSRRAFGEKALARFACSGAGSGGAGGDSHARTRPRRRSGGGCASGCSGRRRNDHSRLIWNSPPASGQSVMR